MELSGTILTPFFLYFFLRFLTPCSSISFEIPVLFWLFSVTYHAHVYFYQYLQRIPLVIIMEIVEYCRQAYSNLVVMN